MQEYTHMLIGGDFTAQVAANDEPDATNDEREHGAIDSKYVGRHAFCAQGSRGQWLRQWAVEDQSALGNTFIKTRRHQKNVPLNKTLEAARLRTDEKSLEQALQRCWNKQIDMDSDRKAVMARINLPIGHETQQTQRSTKKKTKKQGRSELEWAHDRW